MEIVGIILPPFIDLINKFVKDSTYRFIVAFLFCAVVGVLLSYLENSLINYSDAVKSILAVFGASQLTYRPIYEGSRVDKLIQKI